MKKLNEISVFLGLNRSTVGLLTMVILVGMGERMAERFLPIYLMALGGGALTVGLLNGMDNLLSALYSFPGGYLSDRLGAKRALLIFNLIAIFGFSIVILIPTWQAVLIGAVFFLSWSAISLPATMGLVARVLPMNKRTMGVSMHSLVRRVPMALGPVIGGVCIARWGEAYGVRVAFAAALLLACVAAFLQQILIEDDRPASQGILLPAIAHRNPLKVFKDMPASLKRLLISDILVRFCEQIPYAFVVVWCMKTITNPVSAVQFGLLTTVEMATAMLIYIPVAYRADRGTKKPYVLATFGFFTVFPLALLFSHSFSTLAFAFVIRGLKEFGEPTRKSLIMDLAPEGRKAVMFGLYYLIRDVVVSVAAFGGSLLWIIRPEVNLLAAFGFGLLGTVSFAMWGQDVFAPTGDMKEA